MALVSDETLDDPISTGSESSIAVDSAVDTTTDDNTRIDTTTDTVADTDADPTDAEDIIAPAAESDIVINTNRLTISADEIDINGVISANGTFKVTTDGTMTCTAGLVGPWSIGYTGIESTASMTDSAGTTTNIKTYVGVPSGSDNRAYIFSVYSKLSSETAYYPYFYVAQDGCTVCTELQVGETYLYGSGKGSRAAKPGTVKCRDVTASGIITGGTVTCTGTVSGVSADISGTAQASTLSATSTLKVGTSVIQATQQVQSGVDNSMTASGYVPAGSYKTSTVTFDKEFTSKPVVTAAISGTATSAHFGSMSVLIQSVTTTTVTFAVMNNSSGAHGCAINWIAVGNMTS